MDDQSGSGTGDDRATGGDAPPVVGAPRWVTVLGAVAALLALLALVAIATGRGGEHGPGRHGRRHAVYQPWS